LGDGEKKKINKIKLKIKMRRIFARGPIQGKSQEEEKFWSCWDAQGGCGGNAHAAKRNKTKQKQNKSRRFSKFKGQAITLNSGQLRRSLFKRIELVCVEGGEYIKPDYPELRVMCK
jgi:hypothetical protein